MMNDFKVILKERMKIQQAWLDGKKIEFARRTYSYGDEVGGWDLAPSTPGFNWRLNEYRVLQNRVVKFGDLEVGKTYYSYKGMWRLVEKGIGSGEVWWVRQETSLGAEYSVLNVRQIENLACQ